MYLSEQLQKDWAPVLEHADLPAIKDPYRKAITAVILENQKQAMIKDGLISEAAPTNSAGTGGFSGGATATGPVAGFDPILISLVRRSLPNLIAYDVCGVQPMSGLTGLIFAMRSMHGTDRVPSTGTEAFYNEANTSFGGDATTVQTAISLAANTALGNGNVFA